MYLRLKINGSFNIRKKGTPTKPFIEFILFKIIFLVFVQKNGPINVESEMYRVTN